MCFPQREEALKQHKTLSQELVNLRGELGKSFSLLLLLLLNFMGQGEHWKMWLSCLHCGWSCMLGAVGTPCLLSGQTLTIDISFESWQLDLQFTEFLALI